MICLDFFARRRPRNPPATFSLQSSASAYTTRTSKPNFNAPNFRFRTLGPYRASLEFLAANPEWRNCGALPRSQDDTKAFDRDRTRIPETDFFVLQAPFGHFVGRIPKTFREFGWRGLDLNGLTIVPASPNQVGTLKVQCVLRAFSEARIVEIVSEADCALDGRAGPIEVKFRRSWPRRAVLRSWFRRWPRRPASRQSPCSAV